VPTNQKRTPDETIALWTERDLSDELQRGVLRPAYGLDDRLSMLTDLVAVGKRPVVTGESGVGKTSTIHEFVRRVHTDDALAAFRGRRFVQLSLRYRLSGLVKSELLPPEMQALIDALLAQEDRIVPFFRDIHLAGDLGVAPQLEHLGLRFRGLLLAEADAAEYNAMVEDAPELERYFVQVRLPEPSYDQMHTILGRWSEDQRAAGRELESSAVEQGLVLTHRFLTRLRHPRKSIDFLEQVVSVTPRDRPVTAADVTERFYQMYRVPRFLIDPTIPFDSSATEREFETEVLGQRPGVQAVVRMIAQIKAGLSDPSRALGTFLFAGPTGVGKTYLAQLLAIRLFGSPDRLIRINMADFKRDADGLSLFGNPDAYAIRHQRGVLTQRVMGHPFAVLLFDELEKAEPSVQDRFLQLIDEGKFINGLGETIDCRSTIIVATTNAGAEIYREAPLGFGGAKSDATRLDRELDRRLRRAFREEFLNRFDDVVHFYPLRRQHVRSIARREIRRLGERPGVAVRQVRFDVDDSVLDWLGVHGYDPYFGARFLRRTVERNVSTVLADAMVRDNLVPDTTIELSVRGGRVVARVRQPLDKKTQRVEMPIGRATTTRTLGKAALLAESQRVLARVDPLRETLEAQRANSAALLERMNDESLWQDPEAAQKVLEEYRAADLIVQMGARLVGPIDRLRDLLEHGQTANLKTESLAAAFEEAASAAQEWERRIEDSESSAVWLFIRSQHVLKDTSDWLRQLVDMELSWCRRIGLDAKVEAYSESGDGISSVVLGIEGPGAEACLAMEQGIHKLHAKSEELRARVDVVPRASHEPSDEVGIHTTPRRKAHFGLRVAWRGRLSFDESGQVTELLGEDRQVLNQIIHDFSTVTFAAPDPARHYGHEGHGAKDPRTGATVARRKDALRGKLHPLLDAWRIWVSEQ